MLSLPAHQLYGGGQSKAVLRRAMTDRLPEVVRRRAAPTQLTPLYELAMRQREHERARAVLAEADPFQRRFVRADWLRAADPGRMPDVVQESALWNSVSYGLWRQRRDEAPVRAPVCPMGD
jgi:hypothetical protein